MAVKRTKTKSNAEALLPLITPQLPQPLDDDETGKVLEDRRAHTGEAMDKQFARIRSGQNERRSFRERRASRRVAVGLPLEANHVRLVTNDLSTFGLSIRGGATPKRGTRLELKLFLPDAPDKPLMLDAEVLGPLGGEDGVRVKFIKPPLDAVRRIHKLVK